MDHPTPASPLVTASHCANLRHKGMYVMSMPDPGALAHHDPYDATAYWCTETARGLGPDGQPVHADRCRGDRDCCQH